LIQDGGKLQQNILLSWQIKFMAEHLSPQQSLQLIQSMIERTKTNIIENSFYFLLWGWMTFGAVLVQFLLKVVLGYRHHYLVWLITIVALIITILHSKRQSRRYGYKTYVGESMGYLWMGIGISFFILTIIISAGIGWLYAWPFFILFYGLGTFVSGKIIQFKPLVVGGIICWILAVACVFVKYDYQLLIAAAAILFSYIIPGHLIQSKSL
jgi:hypothetical protein